jgi:RNA polymerase sigma factor (sigma-70 family)
MSRLKNVPMRVGDFVEDSYTSIGTALHSYLRRRLRRPHDADDLVQDTYEQLLLADQQKLVANPKAYVYGIAVHVLSHFRARETRDLARFELTSEPAEAEAPRSHPTQDEQAERLALRQQLDTALAQLPETHRDVFLCIKHEGLSYVETAQRMNLKVKAIERYFSEAKALLLSTLSQDR